VRPYGNYGFYLNGFSRKSQLLNGTLWIATSFCLNPPRIVEIREEN